MALLDPYVSTEEYNQRVDRTSDADDAILNGQLVSMTRLLEEECGIATGGLNEHTATYTFPGFGGDVLRLRDSDERQYFLQSVPASGIGVDTEKDGTFDGEALSLASGVRGLPENAVAQERGFDRVQLLSYAAITTWPEYEAAVTFTNAVWGSPMLLALAKEAVISMVRDIREHHVAERNPDTGLPMFTDDTWRIIRSLKERINRSLPVVA